MASSDFSRTRVWVPVGERWVAGEILKQDEDKHAACLCRTDEGEEITMPREMLELREVVPDNGVHDLTKLRPVLCMHAPRPNPPPPPSLTRRAAVRACAPAGPQQACARA